MVTGTSWEVKESGEVQLLLSLAENPDKPKQGPTFLLQFSLNYWLSTLCQAPCWKLPSSELGLVISLVSLGAPAGRGFSPRQVQLHSAASGSHSRGGWISSRGENAGCSPLSLQLCSLTHSWP